MTRPGGPRRSLRCDYGWHDPDPIARWNHGYYFSRCRRCGADMVRTAYGRWYVPHGYRVVWRREPPANVAERPEGGPVLPIEEVLHHLHRHPPSAPGLPLAQADPGAGVGGGRPPSGGDRDAPHPPLRSVFPDFMDDGVAAQTFPIYSPPPTQAKPAAEARAPRGGAPPFDPHARPAFVPASSARPGAGGGRATILSAGVAAVFLLILVVLATGFMEPPDRDAAKLRPMRPDLPITSTAYVTASLLYCLNTTSRGAAPVQQLVRGDPLSLVAVEDEWANVSVGGDQCWVPARYLSRERPL